MEIDDNATPFKVGKKVGRRAKVKNATKITADGLEFDSKLEYNCYMILKESGLRFKFKPEKLILVPAFTTKVLVHTEENEKELMSQLRELAPDKKFIERNKMGKSYEKLYRAECKKDQSRAKRIFNVDHKKVLRDKKVLQLTWSPDFYLIDDNLFVESKGFANDSFPLKFKLARYQLLLGYHVETWGNLADHDNAIEVGSKKELNDLIAHLKNKKCLKKK